MSNYKLIKDDEVPDGVVIPDGHWAIKIDEVIIAYESIKFADKPNANGDFPVSIKYDILHGKIPEDLVKFDMLVAELAIEFVTEGEYAKEMKQALVDYDNRI